MDAALAERLLARHGEAYRAASPFPHFFLDGLFPREVVAPVEMELERTLRPGRDGCAFHNSRSTRCWPEGPMTRKTQVSTERLMGPHTRALFAALRSAPFVSFLEQLTGVEELLPDPAYSGSGVHATASGGYLEIHADFNHLPHNLSWHRRVNLFVYFNDNWPEEFGGHLELWNRSMTGCARRILPVLGRVVAFSSTDFSYHGHPSPLPIPMHRSARASPRCAFSAHAHVVLT